MTNEEAIKIIEEMYIHWLRLQREHICEKEEGEKAINALLLSSKALKNEPFEWIPIKTRPLTEEEKEEHPEWSFVYDCQMPEDEQKVLVSTKWGVCTDIYCKDVDGCYFEDHCDEDDVLAWMPFPKPYEED